MSCRKHGVSSVFGCCITQNDLPTFPGSPKLGEEGRLHPQYYNWQKQFFENGAAAFERRPNKANEKRQQNADERKIEQLEKKLQGRNEVVAELLQEHVQLKKALGEP